MACSSAALPLHSPWLEIVEAYGVDARSPADAAADDAEAAGAARWTHNALASDVRQFACGRLASAADAAAGAHSHAAGDAAACAALAAVAAAALAGAYVGRGDEGDHHWLPFVAPALAGAPAAVVGAVREAELRAALGGALCPAPALRFAPQPLAEALRAWELELAAGDEGGDPNRLADALAPLRALRQTFLAAGGGGGGGGGEDSATYLRPAEGERRCGAVLPHFILQRTRAGGLAGVVGFTVYT